MATSISIQREHVAEDEYATQNILCDMKRETHETLMW
jgi:hypothetical protein